MEHLDGRGVNITSRSLCMYCLYIHVNTSKSLCMYCLYLSTSEWPESRMNSRCNFYMLANWKVSQNKDANCFFKEKTIYFYQGGNHHNNNYKLKYCSNKNRLFKICCSHLLVFHNVFIVVFDSVQSYKDKERRTLQEE